MKSTKCTQCGHENDLTRVFCQNCGFRLENAPAAAEPIRKVKPIRVKPTHSGRGPVAIATRLLGWILSTAVLGALLAVIILILRTPDNVPPAKPVNETLAAKLLELLQTFSTSPYVRTCDVSQDQANNYLAATILPSTEGGGFKAAFERAFVVLRKGEFDFVAQQRFLGRSVYVRLTVVPLQTEQGTGAKCVAGAIGRLQVHPILLPWLQQTLSPVTAATAAATAVISKASSVILSADSARLSWHASPEGN